MAETERVVSFFMSVLFMLASVLPFFKTKEVDMDKFELVWADEFDADSLDATKWRDRFVENGTTYMRKGGYWNTDMVCVKDGNLHISTVYYPDGYKDNGMPGWYSASLTTKKLFEQTYGYFEIRCILPKGNGMWSAFWLSCGGIGNVGNGGTDGAEIDIFESPFYGQSIANMISTNVHYDGYGTEHKSTNVCKPILLANNPYEEFNTYALEWNEDEYIFYINGMETGRSSFGGTSKVAEYMILSVEVGGANGIAADSWAGKALASDTQTTDFIVDYVRVYQYK